MTGPLTQLWALLALRWQGARSAGVRSGLLLGAVLVLWLLVQAVRVGQSLDPVTLATALELAPAAYLGFGALALIAPLAAGGGSEVVEADDLVAFPVRPTTQFLGGLVLAPLNLVWVVQLLGLALLTSCLTLDGSLARGAATTAAYVLALTAGGQALAWLVVGLRRTRRGRLLVVTAAALLLAAAAGVARTGALDVAGAPPTRRVVAAVIAGGEGRLRAWAVPTGVLLAAALLGLLCGAFACRWALLQPGDVGAHRTRAPVVRRRSRGGPLRELLAVDRASVWRAPALRRGAVVLAVLPGLLAAGAGLPWSSLVVLPGLVAAGAALLFGVNAFSLDAGGSVWLASLPHDPALALRAKALVVTETVLGAVALAVLGGSVRSPGAPTGAELSALTSSAVLCTAVVVTLALRASVRSPHRAVLSGPRDAVAPPAALALASVRLAVPTAVTGVVLATAAATGLVWLPPALTVPALGLCALSAARTARSWSDPRQRARVVHTVSFG